MKLIKDLGLRLPKLSSKQKKRYGIYECPKCKKHFEAQTYKVNAGQSQCASCARKLGKKHRTHGMTGSRVFVMYSNMFQRCENPNHKSYDNYGARGIKVCDEWRNDCEAFINWAMKNGYQDHLTIDRVDSDAGYFPSNCRFVDRKAQAQNRRKREGLKTEYIGTRVDPDTGNYNARLMVDGGRVNIGTFKTEIEAAIARDRYILDNGLQYSKLNILKRG